MLFDDVVVWVCCPCLIAVVGYACCVDMLLFVIGVVV